MWKGIFFIEEEFKSNNNMNAPLIPIPLSILRFEYLTNLIKLRYLEDCFSYQINRNAPFFTRKTEPIEDVRLISSDGKPFQVYLNIPQYVGGGEGSKKLGPLLSDASLDSISEISLLNTVNSEVYDTAMHTDDWICIFCEYMLIKTGIHELVTDLEEHENDWGYKDLKALLKIAEGKTPVATSTLRDVVVHALRLGLDPSRIESSGVKRPNQSLNQFSSLSYRIFMARCEEWIDLASSALIDIRNRASKTALHTVMKWDQYSPCAFESGPVFIRKEPDWLLPRVTEAIGSFDCWDANQQADKLMMEILCPHLYFLIGSYWHHFDHKCDVRFFEENRELAKTIPPIRNQLTSWWAELQKVSDDRPSDDLIMKHQSVVGARKSVEHPRSFEYHINRANEIGVGKCFSTLTGTFNELFPACWPMNSSVNYRVRNVFNYNEADVFNLYTRGSGRISGLKFRVYYNVLSAFFGQNVTKEDILNMLPGIEKDAARRGHEHEEAEWFFEGFFTSPQQANSLVKQLRGLRSSRWLK